jgi:DHA2 family multidrug resistance protein-like MFS transporter
VIADPGSPATPLAGAAIPPLLTRHRPVRCLVTIPVDFGRDRSTTCQKGVDPTTRLTSANPAGSREPRRRKDPQDMEPTIDTTPRAGRKEWIGLAVLALPAMLLAMDMTVLYLAVPHLSADLNPSSSQLLWILDIYGFLVAGFLITMGNLGDRIGRRRLLLIGGAAFAVASIVAAYSNSAEMLIVTRAFLGIAGATLMPSTLALIRNMFHDEAQRTTAIAAWMSSFMVGSIIGPIVGGALLESFWWGSVFLVAVPAMVLLLVTGPILLPEYRDPNPGRLDISSVVLSLAAVITTIYGIKELAKEGIDLVPVATILAGLALGAIFARRQVTLADPLLDLSLFANRKFSASLGTLTLALFAMSGTFFFLAQYLQLVIGMEPLEAGLWTLPQALAMMVVAVLTPQFVKRTGPAWVMTGGLVVAVVGLSMLSRLDGSSDLALLVAGQIVMMLGFGPTMILGIDMIVGAAPPERAGAASAISETSQEFGFAIGVAILGSIGSAVYRNSLTDSIPAGVPDEVRHVSLDTLGGALEMAGTLPPALGGELVTAARDAFTTGLQFNTTVAAVLTLAAALVPVIFLRGVRPASEAMADPAATEPATSVAPAPQLD